MELNHTKQTLKTAMENENQHLSISDSDSTDSDNDKAITFSSPARFHSGSDSDGSSESQTDKATATAATAAAHGTSDRDSSQPRSSISADSESQTDKATITNSAAAAAAAAATATAHGTGDRDSSQPRSSISADSDGFSKCEKDEVSKIDSATAIANGDSIKASFPPVESPPRSSISSDQISLPNESFAQQYNKPSAAPTRSPPEKPPIPEAVVKTSIKEEPLALVKADLFVGDDTASAKEGGDGGNHRQNRRQRVRPQLSILRKVKRDETVKKAALGFRIFGFLFCLVSFSVMAADRNKGWALDSFERYKEFRYCMSVNVIGFVYSGAQAFDLAYQSATSKNVLQHRLRYMFDFAFDQVVTYLLISASSSAATRIDDWQSNWGKDKFPDMATTSVAMSFLAFVALAFSSLVSGYVLCNSRST